MTDEAMKAAAVAVKSAADEDGEVYLTSGFYSLEERADRVARAAIAAFLKAWEPDEAVLLESIQRVCCGLPSEDWREGLCAAPKCDCYRKHGLRIVPGAVKAAARAEAERMERGG